ncbi:FAD binding domain-containing protein [Nannocystaceae bacterium ST9]
MIRLPTSFEQSIARAGELLRAGGTDLMERRELGLASGDIVDLRDVEAGDRIDFDPSSGARLGAKLTIATLSKHPIVREHYPALALAAGALATPEIRTVATLAGGLLQRSRCWYYRNPSVRCLKSGGTECPARAGDHLLHVCFDLGPCVAPHPSTLGMALLGYDAQIGVLGGRDRSIADLYGDGRSVADHQLGEGEVLCEVRLPPPVAGERGGYRRAIARARAEWPLIEVSTRLVIVEAKVALARVAIGGVAPIPLRLAEVEDALLGQGCDDATLERAAALSTRRCKPLPMTGYKVDMLPSAVLDALVHARGS